MFCLHFISHNVIPGTYFQLLKWMHNRENHFNLLEMAPAKVNHREMMEMLINLLSSWSDSLFNLKGWSLLGVFLKSDHLWQPEKFNHGSARLLLWESHTLLATGKDNKCQERKGRVTCELFWHISFPFSFRVRSRCYDPLSMGPPL